MSLQRNKSISSTRIRSIPIPVILAIAFFLFLLWMTSGNETLQRAILLVIWIILGILVLMYPIIGLGLSISSSVLTDLLPNTPLLSSFIPLIGALTLFGYLFQNRRQLIGRLRFTNIEIISLIWIAWVVISNPQASILGSDRTWIFTLIQLWILVWLTNRLVRDVKDHQIIMLILAFSILISAASVIQQHGVGVLDITDRATGLSGGANTAARYFVYGIVLLGFFQNRRNLKPIWRVIGLAGIGMLMIALIYTGSRTGFLLLFIALILLYRQLSVGKISFIIFWLIIIAGIIWYSREIIGTVLAPDRMLSSILLGSDTVGYRYALWRAGWAMWLDHPLAGVGVGQFGNYLAAYWTSFLRITAASPHSIYVEVLAETGIIGFVLYGSMLMSGLLNFWKRIHLGDPENASINWIWLVVFITLLIGGITKADTIDKLLWFLLAISANELVTRKYLPE